MEGEDWGRIREGFGALFPPQNQSRGEGERIREDWGRSWGIPCVFLKTKTLSELDLGPELQIRSETD